MTPEKFQLLMDLFQQALSLEGDARRRFVEERCGGDAELRHELEALLGESGNEQPHLVTAGGLEAVRQVGEAPAPRGQPSWRDGGFGPGSQPVLSGNYRLLRVLGEGGMGIVYQAEQAFPRRVVALKAMRPGLVSRGLLRRFQNEAQILARLQHPGIAQIYEAGAADEEHADQAFFAMEFVDGRPLTDFARERSLSIQQRLRLMIAVCDAVQHAHQRGVIHRDLKPSNILVDGSADPPQPKVLDFGVARATDRDMQGGGLTAQTDIGQLVGTLPYMSPEQVSADPDAIDTRSDVYALGVILYQLLAGRLPFDVSTRSIADAARIIRDEPPSRLSTLDRAFRGDLDTIVAKALEKDRARRYQSAAELGDDLRRHLAGEPIAAKRDSLGYLLQKRVRQYRWAVVASVALVAVLAGFLIHAVNQSRELADQLAVANIERGRAIVEGGSITTGGDVLWREFLRNPESVRARWALRELFTKTPILDSMSESNVQPSRLLLSPAGDRVAIIGIRGRVAVCSRDLTHTYWEIANDGPEIYDAAFTPDGRSLCLVVERSAVRIIDAADGQVKRTLAPDGLTDPMRLAITPDGRSLAVSCYSGRIGVIDLDAEQPRIQKDLFGARTQNILSYTPGGDRLIVGGSDGNIAAWSPDLEENVWRFREAGRVQQIAFIDVGRTILAATTARTVLWIDARSGQVLERTTISPESVTSLEPIGGERLVAVGGDHSLDLIDVSTRKVVRTLDSDPGHDFVVVEGVRPRTLIVGGVAACAQIWQLDPEAAMPQLGAPHRGWVLAVSPSTSGERLLTLDSEGYVRLWDPTGRRELAVSRVAGSGTRAGVLSPDGSLAYVGTPDGIVEVLNADDGLTPLSSIAALKSSVASLALSPDGRILAVSEFGGHISLWDAHSNRLLREWDTGHRQLTNLRFSPDSRRLVTGGFKPTLALWDVESGQKLQEIVSDTPSIGAVFSPDGATIAYTGRVRTIELIDAATFRPIRTLEGHSHLPACVAFSPDGAIVASGAVDGKIRFWEADTGGELMSIRPDNVEISRIAFTPDGRGLIAAGRSGKVWTCDLEYFDRHIAGNVRYQLRRQRDRLPGSPDESGVLRWADDLLRRDRATEKADSPVR